ncbi:hypothetical protein NDU88_004597 [Pleurodeles waltl]|uniref:Uncharacterized protein n=1 Tax=Pleurodeles waltl TaxID=8319 RepID=A0AAV7WW52_PLEWA|nr:hypothetical protein NDU88_004597 [Pleurodeles waltl]
MRVHTRSCPLRLTLLREVTYEPSVLRSTMDDGTATDDFTLETTAHYCSVDPVVSLALNLTSDDVDSFLGSLVGDFDDTLRDHAYSK